jgi:DNA invertase Pin-like site-specific DNA recombinase
MRVAIYARVSTGEQSCENQLIELRRYCEARKWSVFKEYVGAGVSGAKDRRRALDQLLADVRRRRVDAVVCWSIDRMGRSLKHLVVLLDDLQALGVGFISLREGLDWTTASGRLQAQLLAVIAEFERARIQERVMAGLARAKAQGRKLGRPEREISFEQLATIRGLPLREAARRLGIPRTTLQRALARIPAEQAL